MEYHFQLPNELKELAQTVDEVSTNLEIVNQIIDLSLVGVNTEEEPYKSLNLVAMNNHFSIKKLHATAEHLENIADDLEHDRLK